MNKFLIALRAAALAVLIFSIPVGAQSLKKVVEQLATPLEEPVTMYRWQSQGSADSLLESGDYSQKLYNYFSTMTVDNVEHFRGGRGIYASENPYSSSVFARGLTQGSLVEVRLAKGTKMLDLSDPKIAAALQRKGIETEKLLWASPAPDVVIKYNSNEKWWVVKGRTGVTFKPFDGSKLKPTYLLNMFDKMENSNAKLIYLESVKGQMVKIGAKDFGQVPTLAKLMHHHFHDIAREGSLRGYDLIAQTLNQSLANVKTREELLKVEAIMRPEFENETPLSRLYKMHDRLEDLRKKFSTLQDLVEVKRYGSGGWGSSKLPTWTLDESVSNWCCDKKLPKALHEKRFQEVKQLAEQDLNFLLQMEPSLEKEQFAASLDAHLARIKTPQDFVKFEANLARIKTPQEFIKNGNSMTKVSNLKSKFEDTLHQPIARLRGKFWSTSDAEKFVAKKPTLDDLEEKLIDWTSHSANEDEFLSRLKFSTEAFASYNLDAVDLMNHDILPQAFTLSAAGEAQRHSITEKLGGKEADIIELLKKMKEPREGFSHLDDKILQRLISIKRYIASQNYQDADKIFEKRLTKSKLKFRDPPSAALVVELYASQPDQILKFATQFHYEHDYHGAFYRLADAAFDSKAFMKSVIQNGLTDSQKIKFKSLITYPEKQKHFMDSVPVVKAPTLVDTCSNLYRRLWQP